MCVCVCVCVGGGLAFSNKVALNKKVGGKAGLGIRERAAINGIFLCLTIRLFGSIS